MSKLHNPSDGTRMEFAVRLQQSLDRIGFGSSPARLAEAFNRRSAADTVSTHGARKWLMGGSIPTQSRLVVLAQWLQVDAAWLRFGDRSAEATAEPGANVELQGVLSDLHLLSPTELKVVRGLLDVIFQARRG